MTTATGDLTETDTDAAGDLMTGKDTLALDLGV
jgi:hypothetical protein